MLPLKHPPAPVESKQRSPLVLLLTLIALALLHRAVRLLLLRWPWEQPDPIVHLDFASYRGMRASEHVRSFRGMRYADPLTPERRFRPAVFPPTLQENSTPLDATRFGAVCPQQPARAGPDPGGLLGDVLKSLPHWAVLDEDDEDCLFVNVWTPAKGQPSRGEGLPVLVWFHGGGFELGGSSSYSGLPIVSRSVELGEPIIFVSLNMRLNAFGHLASRETLDEGEGASILGLDDQRTALRWIQRYINHFGGDPKKVTIWGQSAGAISVGLHLVGPPHSPPLFRAAFLQSGAPIPVGSATHGKRYYDSLVESLDCSHIGTGETSLDCLRRADWREIKRAVSKMPGVLDYQSLNLAWLPRVDRQWLKRSPWESISRGEYARVPLMVGNCDDEGTLFALASLNDTTSDSALAYLRRNFAPEATDADVAHLRALYPTDPTRGSPFGTGYLNQLSPQFKRIAAVLGDVAFHSPRRHLLSFASETQDVWAYIYTRGKATPWLGSFHASDVESEFFGVEILDHDLMDHLISFVTRLTPNRPSSSTEKLQWPRWTNDTRLLVNFHDHPPGFSGASVEEERWREEGLSLLGEWASKWPL